MFCLLIFIRDKPRGTEPEKMGCVKVRRIDLIITKSQRKMNYNKLINLKRMLY